MFKKKKKKRFIDDHALFVKVNLDKLETCYFSVRRRIIRK